jgi:hypothetical protein
MSYTVKEIYWKRPTLFPVVLLGSTTPSSVSLHRRALPASYRKNPKKKVRIANRAMGFDPEKTT